MTTEKTLSFFLISSIKGTVNALMETLAHKKCALVEVTDSINWAKTLRKSLPPQCLQLRVPNPISQKPQYKWLRLLTKCRCNIKLNNTIHHNTL
jgi:hypothetical protein